MKAYALLVVIWLTACGCGQRAGTSSGEASLEDLNRALSVMTMGGRRLTNINELAGFPSLRGKSWPKPPAGKKLAIDPTGRAVGFVDE